MSLVNAGIKETGRFWWLATGSGHGRHEPSSIGDKEGVSFSKHESGSKERKNGYEAH